MNLPPLTKCLLLTSEYLHTALQVAETTSALEARYELGPLSSSWKASWFYLPEDPDLKALLWAEVWLDC